MPVRARFCEVTVFTLRLFTPVKILNSDGSNTIIAANYYYEQTDEGSKQVATVSPYDEIKKVSQKDTEKAAQKEKEGSENE